VPLVPDAIEDLLLSRDDRALVLHAAEQETDEQLAITSRQLVEDGPFPALDSKCWAVVSS
jgi:hypothetical protein